MCRCMLKFELLLAFLLCLQLDLKLFPMLIANPTVTGLKIPLPARLD